MLRDADDLRTIAEGLADDPPAVDDVVAQCEQQPQATPDAVYEEADGTATDVALATTADGYAAVSLDDLSVTLLPLEETG